MHTMATVTRGVPTAAAPPRQSPLDTIAAHWPEYLMEAAALGIFLISACVFAVLIEHPASPLNQAIDSPVIRRILGGIVMGLTAISIIYSPWGQRSGAHMNPAVTLTYYLLGKVKGLDAVFYIAAQFAGGLMGVAIAELLIGYPLRHSAVNYAVTVPGLFGTGWAFFGELAISMTLMFTLLIVSNRASLARFTPLFAGALIATFISFEGPLSGMSMNPARTLGSAVTAQEWKAIWIYFVAPLAGMIGGALMYRSTCGTHRVFCAKLHHENGHRCIFRCNYGAIARLGR
jgi:aquaporin Z